MSFLLTAGLLLLLSRLVIYPLVGALSHRLRVMHRIHMVAVGLHELCHAGFAVICGHRIETFALTPRGYGWQGQVIHRPRGTRHLTLVEAMLISFGPLWGGTLLIRLVWPRFWEASFGLVQIGWGVVLVICLLVVCPSRADWHAFGTVLGEKDQWLSHLYQGLMVGLGNLLLWRAAPACFSLATSIDWPVWFFFSTYGLFLAGRVVQWGIGWGLDRLTR